MCLEAKTQISISVKEIYDKLCPECKAKIRELIKEKITDKMVSGVIGEKQ